MSSADYPLVSILVANFNNGRFIAETLASAAKQTYPNTEIVVVDDGSEDDSLAVVGDFMATHPEVRIRLFKNSDNKGCGRIKRQCVELSEGEYFCFLDPEDTILPEAVETLMAVFKDYPECGLVYSTHYLCNEKLEPQGVSDYPGLIPKGQSHLTSTAGHISALALCNRRVYEKTSGINPAYLVAEDQDLYLKMEEQAPVVFFNQPLYYYRKHDHNMSWNEQRRARNTYYRHCARSAAYHRRRCKGTVPNLTRREYHKECLSCHLQLRRYYHDKGSYLKAFWQIILSIPYCYTL